jgi:hypothetical protein
MNCASWAFPSADGAGADSSTACNNAEAFGIGSSRSAKEFARNISLGAGAGVAWAAFTAQSDATAPKSPAIFLSISSPPVNVSGRDTRIAHPADILKKTN